MENAWLLTANNESYELGEGYTVNAYSQNLTSLVEYAFEDALNQNNTELRVRDDVNLEENEDDDVVLEYEYAKDSWGIWCVIELGDVPESPIDVDSL